MLTAAKPPTDIFLISVEVISLSEFECFYIITTDNYGTTLNNILADLTRWELILKKKILPRIKFCSSIPLTTSWVLE